MAEDLTPADVEAYTQGRLLASDPETARLLAASLDRVRRFCGWHVSPVQSNTESLDGEGWPYFVLPTRKVVDIVSITEDGNAVDLTTVRQKTDEPGVIYKRDAYWCGEIEIEYTHGYTADEAAAFRDEVLALIERTEMQQGTGAAGPLTGIEVDDVNMRWSGVMDRSWGIAKNPLNESVLYKYRILPV
ncbi:hypothetical protein [Mycobacterium phage WXIN]|nr:hypothetical protein [Mycobacterium phage WXIN]